jgi:hypothetical protein
MVPAAISLLTWGGDLLQNKIARDCWWLVLFLFVLTTWVRPVRAWGLGRAAGLRLFHVRVTQAVLPMMMVGWCFLPYLGVTSHPCLAMYSHLSIHSGTSNHFFMPAGLQIDAFQDDLVEITRSTSRRFPKGARIPRLGLRKALYKADLRGKAPRRVSWMEDGRQVTFRRGQPGPWTLITRVPLISFNGQAALRDAEREVRREARREARRRERKREGDTKKPARVQLRDPPLVRVDLERAPDGQRLPGETGPAVEVDLDPVEPGR